MRAPVLAVELVRMPSALALAFGMAEAESLWKKMIEKLWVNFLAFIFLLNC